MSSRGKYMLPTVTGNEDINSPEKNKSDLCTSSNISEENNNIYNTN